MEDPRCLQANCFFRGKEHSIQLSVSQAVLEVEVQERCSTKRWRGRFDAACELPRGLQSGSLRLSALDDLPCPQLSRT